MGYKYSRGLIIGRFQPFHKGHLFLVRWSLKYVEHLVIGLGSSGLIDSNNFLTDNERRLMIEKVRRREGWQARLSEILSIADFPDDEVWFKKLIQKTGFIDVVVSNNDWVVDIFTSHNLPVLKPGFYQRFNYEGLKIRQLMAQGKKWQDRLPIYLRDFPFLNKITPETIDKTQASS